MRYLRNTYLLLCAGPLLAALIVFVSLEFTGSARKPDVLPSGTVNPPSDAYLLDGRAYRHDTQAGVDEHIRALWAAYEREYHEIYTLRQPSPKGEMLATMPPDRLRVAIGKITGGLPPDFHPDDLPKADIPRFHEALVSCLQAKLLIEGLEFCAAIRRSNPPALRDDPSGYYDDFNGGEICVYHKNGKYRVQAGAGRGPNSNSDHSTFEGPLKDGVISGEDRTHQHPRLLVKSGMLNLEGAGDRLDATYVRMGVLTSKGIELLEHHELPLGRQICTDAEAEIGNEFSAKGFRLFAPRHDHIDFHAEAEQIVGYQRKPSKAEAATTR